VIKVDKISKNFLSGNTNLPVLADISFELGKKEIISIVGKTGCGKTTLLNIICGLLSSDKGEVIVNGNIGYVPQKSLLLPWRNILENVLLPVEIKENFNEEIVLQAKHFLEEFDLKEFTNSYPSEISGGMKQKVSLIRTFIQNPDILLLDEPFSAIDFNSRLELVEKLRDYILSSGKSAILVTHNIEEAISISDKIIVLGLRPANILCQEVIKITEKKRKPADIRKTKEFEYLFEKIWRTMSNNYEK
jgi:NitT/TauT family transport system ATP-binding protein